MSTLELSISDYKWLLGDFSVDELDFDGNSGCNSQNVCVLRSSPPPIVNFDVQIDPLTKVWRYH